MKEKSGEGTQMSENMQTRLGSPVQEWLFVMAGILLMGLIVLVALNADKIINAFHGGT